MKKKKKSFEISADMFNDPKLIRLMDIVAFLSPAKTKDEAEIRAKDKRAIAENRLGEPVHKPNVNQNGVLERDCILSGVSLFGEKPEITEQDIRLIKNAGFDFIINGNRGEYGQKVQAWCRQYGLAVLGEEVHGALTGDWAQRIQKGESGVFSEYKPHPATVGDLGFDEPNVSAYGYIASYFKAYHREFPNRFLFCNLFPAGAIKKQLGIKPYSEYINLFSRIVPSDYISVDIYPFHPAKIINKYEMAICLNTYHCVADACRRDNKDFWLYIQTQGRWFSHLYTMTTYEMIKWQVYASLCYGCKSIIHASYNPVWGNDAVGMIDYQGNLTEQYLYAKRVNAEIALLSPVLKNYKSLGVEPVRTLFPNPHFIFANPLQRIKNKQQGFCTPDYIKKIAAHGSALIGYFANDDGGKAFMLVNNKNIYSPYATQGITVTLDKPYRICVYEKGKLSNRFYSSFVSVTPGSCDGVFVTLSE